MSVYRMVCGNLNEIPPPWIEAVERERRGLAIAPQRIAPAVRAQPDVEGQVLLRFPGVLQVERPGGLVEVVRNASHVLGVAADVPDVGVRERVAGVQGVVTI